MTLREDIEECEICRARFAATVTAHRPRPIVWLADSPKILIASQAPGLKAHKSGVPFMDPSGVRLRDWLGLSEAQFYKREDVAILPMGFCFPGYDATGSDLPPPNVCGETWHARVLAQLPAVPLRVLVGASAHRYHLGVKTGVTQTVAAWTDHAPGTFVLPHPSWRNSAWLKKNPWFAADVLPALRARVKEVLND